MSLLFHMFLLNAFFCRSELYVFYGVELYVFLWSSDLKLISFGWVYFKPVKGAKQRMGVMNPG